MPTAEFRLTSRSPGWEVEWFCNGQAMQPPVVLDAAADCILRGISRNFLSLFEQGQHPFQDPADLRRLGQTLFDLVFAPAWPAVRKALGAEPHVLLLRTDEPALLNLPWELVELHPELPLGCDPAWGLLRVPAAAREDAAAPLDPGPLRVLFLSAAPTDQRLLDFEREEDAMLQATGRLSQEVVVLPFAETGGIKELAALVSEHRPHLVHLSGHGRVDGGIGQFAFEDERGRSDSQPADAIVGRVFRGSATRCVVLNACQSTQAAAAGLAQKLIEAGVPLVLGWAASVADDRATQFITAFYQFLARGNGVPAAAAHARNTVWHAGRQRRGGHELVDATFALPQLYAAGPSVELVDRAALCRPYAGPRTEPALLEDGIKGLREGFIGRRRLQQELLPALRDGTITFAVLYGLGGMGKSTLATRAANRLKEAGFTVYGVKAVGAADPAAAGQATLSKLLDALLRAFTFAKRADLVELLTAGKLPLGQRLRLAVQGLRELRVALVLDNLEDVLDLGTRRIADPGLREAYQILARDLTAGSRVLVTCRYLPAETPADQATVWARDVTDLSEAEFRKFLRRDTVVDARLRSGELTGELLRNLHGLLGGTPGFLLQLRSVLRTADPDVLLEDPLAEGLPLEAARQRYYERIFLPQLYAVLPPTAQELVSRLAVSELPIPLEALAGLVGSATEAVEADAHAGVTYGLVQSFVEEELPTLYHPPGLVRPWLVAEERLSEEARRAADGWLAHFWRESYEQNREQALRVPIDIELMTCRNHASRAGERELFRWATGHLAGRMERRSEWQQARALLDEITEADRDGATWQNLATIDLNEGSYTAAREKSAKALAIVQAIGDRMGEATTWHNLASIDLREGSYTAAREKFAKSLAIVQAIGDRAGEAATWHNLGSIDLREGSYAAAREKLAKSLAMRQVIGDRAGEAATWHLLASIDLREGSYAAAREKFAKSLAMRQVIGDRAGEATTWHQLGFTAWHADRKTAAVKLVALCVWIAQSIGHDDAKRTLQNLVGMCAALNYDQARVLELVKEAAEAYAGDQGRQLLCEAFPEITDTLSG